MSENAEKEMVILHLEDNPMDRQIVEKTLQSEKLKCRILACETKQQFENALQQGGFQLMLVDYQLPGFSGHEALEIARQECPDIPFVFLSGVLGEEAAIESLKSGATDYVLKQRMERLVPAVKRAFHEAEEHRQLQLAEAAHRRSEARFRVFMDNLPGLAFFKDRNRRWLWFNHRWNDILDDGLESYLNTERDDFLPPTTAISAKELELQVLESGMPVDSTEKFGPRDDPNRQWLITRFLIDLPDGESQLGGIAFDITERVKAEEKLIAEKKRLQELVDQNLSILAEHDKRLA